MSAELYRSIFDVPPPYGVICALAKKHPFVRVELSGKTWPHKDLFKKAGFRFDVNRKVWYKYTDNRETN